MHSLSVETHGNPQGPELLCLHGWGLHSAVFEPLLPHLEQDYLVHLVDIPGFGHSAHKGQHDDIIELLAPIAERIERPVHLMGWSMGGLLSLALAHHFPSKVHSVFTVCSTPCFTIRHDWQHAKEQGLLGQFAEALTDDFEGTVKRFLSLQTIGAPEAKADLKHLNELLAKKPMPKEQALLGGLKLLEQTDLRAELKALSQPVTMTFGRLDGLVPKAVAGAIQTHHPEVQCHVFNKAAHAPFISHPEEFVAQLAEHINRAENHL